MNIQIFIGLILLFILGIFEILDIYYFLNETATRSSFFRILSLLYEHSFDASGFADVPIAWFAVYSTTLSTLAHAHYGYSLYFFYLSKKY